MKTQDQITQIGTEWLGITPEGWGVSKLWELYTYKKERSDKEEELLSVYRDHGVIPKSSRDDNHNEASEDLSNYLLVRPDDLVINKMKAWQGSISISAYRGIVSPAYFTYQLTQIGRRKLHLKYLHHLLRSRMYIETYKRISKGIRPGQWDLDPYQFKVLPIILPPIETQKDIATFLDERTKVIDELVAKKENLIELLSEKRRSLIDRVVTNGLDPKAKMKSSGIDWLGNVPIDWEIVSFKKIFKLSHERVADDLSVNSILAVSGYRGVEPKDVSSMEGQMPSEDVSNYRIVRKGQLAVNTMWLNYAGLGVSNYEGYISPAYRSYNIDQAVNGNFIHHLLRSYTYVQRYSSMLYGLRPNSLQVKNYDFERIEVLLPPSEDQEKIAKFLDVETAKIDEATALIESQIRRLKEYRSSLIYSAVTGKIKI